MGWLQEYERYQAAVKKVIDLDVTDVQGAEEDKLWAEYALAADNIAQISSTLFTSCMLAIPEIARLKDIDGHIVLDGSIELLAKMHKGQYNTIQDLRAQVEVNAEIHKKWLAMVDQSDADNALINVLHQEMFELEKKLAAVDEIAVSYFQYIEEGETADQAFYPSDEQCQVIKEAQHRLAKAALEVALDETEAEQLAPPDVDEDEDLTHLMPMTIHTDAQFKAWLDGDILTD